MADDPGEWIEKDAFVMPELPAELKIDPGIAALLHITAFLELSGDGVVDPDAAVEAMEQVGHYLTQLSPSEVKAVREQISRVAKHARKSKWGEEAIEFFADYLDNFGVGDEDE